MSNLKCTTLIAFLFLISPSVWSQATESSINKQLQNLRAVASPPMPGSPSDSQKQGVPDAQRPAMILQVAKDINTLPAGASKVKLATSLAQIASAGEIGHDALQAVADTLAQTLTQTPQQPGKDGLPALPYMELAKLAHYAQITTSFQDPMLAKANDVLVANDADVAKDDFTLKDLNGKKYTLSGLKGKIVLINFWATDCAACRQEMTDLDLIYTHYVSQGLVILSITNENPFNVNKYVSGMGYHPPVLSDDGGKVGKAFHTDGVPRTFVFDRDGKLVGESIDRCTQRQFFVMLSKAGLQPAS
jgi:peroxiredoxin